MKIKEFINKTVVVTGAASGIGYLLVQCFAKEGANVALIDISDHVYSCAEEINQNGGNAIGIKCDVRDYHQVCSARDEVVKCFNSLDIMVNCAGGAAARVFGYNTQDFTDIPIEVFDWGIDVNFKGTFYFCHSVMQQMEKQNGGVIINFGSVAGEEGNPRNVDYAASKSGIMYGLTKSLALAGAAHNIRVGCISPGPVLTRPEMSAMNTLIGRAAEPQEIVDVVMFFASKKASFMTGINILVDGGRSIMFGKE